MSERTLIFHRTSLPDDTVLLAQPSVMTVTAVQRNGGGAIIGQYTRGLDPWPVVSYELALGDPTGQNEYRHLELTVNRHAGVMRETIEVAPGGELTVAGVAVNEDGHRTQPHIYRVPFEGLRRIDTGEYALKPAGRNHAVLGLIVGKQPVTDGQGRPVGWLPVYDDIKVPEA